MMGVILYGPPASGKTSVAEALERLDPRFVAFRRLKAGGGRKEGYRLTTIEEIDRLNACGDIIWRNDRYGSTYAVDRPELLAQLAKGTPLIQLGQSEAITAVVHATSGVRWYVVSLHCSRHIAAERMQYRGDINIDERLAAWDKTVNVDRADLTVDTGTASPADVAVQIHSLVQRSAGGWTLS